MRSAATISGLAVLALLIGCSGPTQMATGPSVLGAEGQVKVAQDANGNTAVKILIRHLADPQKVAAGATVYVAWIQPSEGGAQQNIGQIQLDQDQAGRLETVTPLERFTITVTPERTPTVAAPTGKPVLVTRIGDDQ